MPFLIPTEHAKEVKELSQQFGPPLITREVRIGSATFWSDQTRHNRLHEVCMTIRRPNRQFLTFRKTFYPKEVYRLLTGGVEHKERVLDALFREAYEEIGSQVVIRRLLAVLTYRAEEEGKREPGPIQFSTFAFLLDAVNDTLRPIDPEEQIDTYKEIPQDTLLSIADQLDSLPNEYSAELRTTWREWGQFRAMIHRAVWDALEDIHESQATQ